ncbi:peptide/nickel transport system substrate-binding protein [Arthrobacter ginsengisoli]|uniref:Peptide/nickel transport system substrate-binding protein n=1 Tax=Arthrobacter ginsengisoli TaxID=1356565 RepID=A0ABU1UG24_9MICC|nr:ABC transporter substrate-binding protein [Arthrobacter ginsengisoli]MDR7084141.1 peptide/nickel transport system substrate-binding protein [Arthrobacter ginsengisoli]
MSTNIRAPRRLAAATFVALALALSSCSPPPASQAAAAPASNVATDPTAVLRYIYPNAPGTMDPHVVNTAFANVPLFLVFDRLVHVDTAGKAIPGLAESWEYSSDGLKLTLHLRKNVKFQDGDPFNAAAVKANIEHGQTVPASFVKGDLSSIASVTVVDANTVELNLSAPDVGLVLKLSDRAGAMISPKSMASANLNVHPVGAGMYEMNGDYQVGVKFAVKKFDGYWDPSAQKLAGVQMSFMADTTAILNSIKSGGADAGVVREPEIDGAKAAGLQVVEGYDLGFGNILMNPELVPALKDERVRMAVNLAIDRKEIVDGVLFGYGKVTNQPFPEGYFAHSGSAANYAYDPEKAKTLLAEAGFKDGFAMTIDNVPGPGTRINEAMAAQLAKVGIRVTVRQTEAAAASAQYGAKKADALSVRWTGRPDPTSTLSLIFMPGGSNNPSNMASENAIALFNKQKAEADPAKREALLQELSKELVDHPPASNIVLFQSVTATAGTKKVVGLEGYVTGKLEFRGVGMTK